MISTTLLPSILPQKGASHKEAQNHMNDLQIFSNPAFDQSMADIFTTEKKE